MARLPYPGLRAFQYTETDLFFGREDAIDSMVERLGEARFLAVLGASGSGKSSVVKTGLRDALEMGFLKQAGSRWRVIEFSPGGQPRRNLAAALLPAEASPIEIDLLDAHISQGPRSLIEWCRNGNLAAGENLLLLVDQFEELFRYGDYAGKEEAEAFVALLLESAAGDQPIYVALTMRSEYLAACTLIDGLAEAINRGQYLTPRLTREQCRSAIVGPAAVCGFEVAPDLVNRLLNDLDTFAPWDDGSGSVDQLARLIRRADQLPLLQHALNRMWTLANADRERPRPIVLTAADYDRVGGLSGALNAHAAEILAELGPARRPLAESVFRALTSGQSVAEAVRRPLSLHDLVAATGAPEADVRAVVEAFAAPGRNLLQIKPSGELGAKSLIDISHESLIRQWTLLSDWLEAEAAAGATWRRLRDDEALHESGKGNLLRDLGLATVADWWDREKPNANWADRYGNRFDQVRDFFQKSRDAEQQRRDAERDAERRIADLQIGAARRLTRRTTAIAALLAVVAAAAGVLGWIAWERSRQAADLLLVAEQAQATAEMSAVEAMAAQEAEAVAALAADEARQQAESALTEARTALTTFRIGKLGELIDQPAVALKILLESFEPGWPEMPSARLAIEQLLLRHATLENPPEPIVLVPDDLLHTDAVIAAEFSPDDTRLLTASHDGTVLIWSVDSGEPVLRIDTGNSLTHAAFSPNGEFVLTVSPETKIAVWRSDNGNLVNEYVVDELLFASMDDDDLKAEWLPDGQHIVVGGSDHPIDVWSVETATRIRTITPERFSRWTLSPDGHYFAGISRSGSEAVSIFPVEAGGADHRLPGFYYRSVAFSGDGRMLATGSKEGEGSRIAIWSTETWTPIAETILQGAVRDLAFSSDGERLVVSGGNEPGLGIWTIGNNSVDQLAPDPSPARLASSHGGNLVVGTFYERYTYTYLDFRERAVIWSASTGEVVATLGSDPAVTGVRYMDGAVLIAAYRDGHVRAWSLTDRTVIWQLAPEPGVPLEAIDLSASGDLIAVATRNGAVYTRRGTAPFRTLREAAYPGIVDAYSTVELSLSPDGMRLALAPPYEPISVLDTVSGDTVSGVGSELANASSIDFSPDGELLAATSWDATALISTEAWAPVAELDTEGAGNVRFAHDGRLLLVTKYIGGAQIWSPSIPSALQRRLSACDSDNAEFSIDNRLVVCGGPTWISVDFGWVLFSGDGFASSIAVSPVGQSAAFGFSDGMISVYELPTFDDALLEARRVTREVELTSAQLCEFLIQTDGCASATPSGAAPGPAPEAPSP